PPGQAFHDALGIVPELLPVEAYGAACAFVLDQALLVHGHNLGVLFRQPDRRCRRRRSQHDLNAGLSQRVHHALEPAKVELALYWFAQTPNEFADANDIDARHLHEFRVTLPGAFGIFPRATVW